MTTPFEEDEGDTLPMWSNDRAPSYTVGNRRDTFVPAPRERLQVPAELLDAQQTDISGVWAVRSATVEEVGKPQDRAIATLIRAAPIVVILALLGVPLTWVALGGWDWIWGLTFIGVMALLGILAVTLMDLQWNSPSSTEVRRIDRAYQLKREEQRHRHDERRAIIDAFLKHNKEE